MRIRQTGHYHGDIGNAFAIDIEGMDQTDSVYFSRAKAEKHIGTTTTPPTFAGGTHSFVALDDEPVAREFLACVFEEFRKLTVGTVNVYGPGWFEVEFTSTEFQNLVAGRFTYGGGVVWPHTYNVVRIGASVKHDGNGYLFLFNHGPLFA